MIEVTPTRFNLTKNNKHIIINNEINKKEIKRNK